VNAPLSRAFWLHAASSAAAALLLVVTLVVPDWIEVALGVDPDRGSGLAEWAVMGVLVVLIVAAGRGARREWQLAATPAPARRAP
jgi:hypothetical protein